MVPSWNHPALNQFQIPLIKDFSILSIFWSTLICKSGKKRILTSSSDPGNWMSIFCPHKQVGKNVKRIRNIFSKDIWNWYNSVWSVSWWALKRHCYIVLPVYCLLVVVRQPQRGFSLLFRRDAMLACDATWDEFRRLSFM